MTMTQASLYLQSKNNKKKKIFEIMATKVTCALRRLNKN